MSSRLRALRGATTLDEDSPPQLDQRVRELVSTMLERNAIAPDDVVSLIITATPDVRSAFPATAARSVLGDVPLLGAQELDVEGGMPLCVRVMMHVETTRQREALEHVYLRRAAGLRANSGRAAPA